jgi:dGTPase
MINILVTDLIEATADNLARMCPRDIVDVRAGKPLVGFSEGLHHSLKEMKFFLHRHLYRHFQVLRMTSKAQRIVRDLFSAFVSDPRMLPPRYQSDRDQERQVADYIAGMTDRYAMKEHRRLFAVGEI